MKEYILQPKPMIPLTPLQEEEFETAINCHICMKPLGENRVQDHSHELGFYRGPSHNSCNLNYHIKPKEYKLPVIFHNLRGFDSHLIIKHLDKKHGRIRVIPNNMETYMAFSVAQLQFLDSFQFMNKSLDELAKTLKEDDFKLTRANYPDDG